MIDDYGCTCYSSGADDDCPKHKIAASSSLLPVPEPEVQRDNNRCAICAWPLIEGDGLNPLGCVRGNCSLRPHPEKFYDFDRAEREYGIKFDSKYRNGLPVGRQLAEIKADTLAGIYSEGKLSFFFPDGIYWPGFQRIADYVNQKLASLPVGRQPEPKHSAPEVLDYATGVPGSYTIRRIFEWGPSKLATAEFWNPSGWSASGYVINDRKLADAICNLLASLPVGESTREKVQYEPLHRVFLACQPQYVLNHCPDVTFSLASDGLTLIIRRRRANADTELGLGESRHSIRELAEKHGFPPVSEEQQERNAADEGIEPVRELGESREPLPCEHTFVQNYGNTRRACSKCGRFEELTHGFKLPSVPAEIESQDRSELGKAIEAWAEAKREQILREDTKGDLIAEVRRQEQRVEDALYEALNAELDKNGKVTRTQDKP